MQHQKILRQVENQIDEMDGNHLERAKMLLQSDLWSTGSRLDERLDDPDLLADKARIAAAIAKIDARLGETGSG